MYGSQWEALQLHAVYKKPYFLLQVMREFESVLQVLCPASQHGMKSKVRMINTTVPSYTEQNTARLLPLALLLVPRVQISRVCCQLYCYACAARQECIRTGD